MLLQDLGTYAPADPHERAMLERMRAFVAAYDGCFDRTLGAGHVTGSGWIVDRDGTATLLTHHRKLHKWLQPGGHADGDGNLRRVALREATEESGLRDIQFASERIFDVDVHEIPARALEPAHLHFDIRFAFYGDRDEVPVASDESHAVAWIPLDRIESFAIDDSVRRLVLKTPALVGRAG